MTMTIDLTPAEEAQLDSAARRAGVAPSALVKTLVREYLPSLKTPNLAPPAGNAAAITLLQTWLRDEATDDPEEIRKAQAELDEFKRDLNANRAATGERLVFPE